MLMTPSVWNNMSDTDKYKFLTGAPMKLDHRLGFEERKRLGDGDCLQIYYAATVNNLMISEWHLKASDAVIELEDYIKELRPKH